MFTEVDSACTRFDKDSPLMRANDRPDQWNQVSDVLFRCVLEAHRFYLRTRGRFDPRVFGDLVKLGYDRSLPFEQGGVVTNGGRIGRQPLGRWAPRFRGGPVREIHLGGMPIDLGGIGKGLAVRWADDRMVGRLDGYLIDAGGDCGCRGTGPDGDGWRVGVEDPRGGDNPLAVLELRDMACATSSIRLRQWHSGRRPVHHLVDPRTGRPGGYGILAVTVVADDPAEAEVLSKTLFLSGRDRIGGDVARRKVAALWVELNGVVTESPAMGSHVVWRAA